MQQVKFATAKETAEKYGIKTAEEIENLEQRLKYIPMYISTIKDEISSEQMKLQRISDLIQTYEKIVEGNYIDNLVAAERERTQQRDDHTSKPKL